MKATFYKEKRKLLKSDLVNKKKESKNKKKLKGLKTLLYNIF
jgi:hypothetical protein